MLSINNSAIDNVDQRLTMDIDKFSLTSAQGCADFLKFSVDVS